MRHRTLAVLLGVAAAVLLPATASAQFQLALQDPGFSSPGTSSAQVAMGAFSDVHASIVRLSLPWSGVAPGGSSRPAGFDASNPGDPHYNWTSLDNPVRALAQRHVTVVLDLNPGAPAWATPPGKPSSLNDFHGAWNPNAREFGLFAHAVAQRYNGHFGGLPRVSKFEIWNEPNLPEDLMAPDLVTEYRSLLNNAYSQIKRVSRSDVVAVGGLAPVSFIKNVSVSPLKFAAQLMCLRRVATHFVRAGRCPSKAHFDVLAMHPYSLLATPTKHAYAYDDVLIGDMGKITTLLHAARKLHTVAAGSKFGLWVTEFSWFTNPPDKQVGDPPMVSARYTAYSMYEMWRAGASFVTWFLARDPQNPGVNSPGLVYGGGLEDLSGKPKPMERAFAFPVIAHVSGGRGYVWGRAPVSRRTRVIVERARGHGWTRLGVVTTGHDGVFQLRFSASGNVTYRARISHGAASLGYNSKRIPPVRTHTS